MSNSLVSIIINCYNGEKYLQDAVNSIFNQTYKNWEIVFWDNQSTDKSAEIFKTYKDSRLKYYLSNSHTKILYEARSYALEKANGDFIAFLDVDDWWEPTKLEKQIPLFQNSKIGLVYCNLWRFFKKKNKRKIYRKKRMPVGMILNDLLKDYVIGSPTYIIRKSSLKSLNYSFDKRFHIIGDFDLNTRLASIWEVGCIQEPLATARIHGKNESLINKDKEIDELKIWYDYLKKDPIFKIKTEFYQINLKILYLEIFKDISEGKFKKSLKKIVKYPFSFNKLKLAIALLLPKYILNKIKNY